MKNVYHVGSGELTFDIIERIINENLKLELAPEAKERIQKCRDYLDHKIAESEEPLYGITTGFGSLCSKNISPDELGTLQENLIKSHACSVGEEIRPVIVKLMMLLKAHALSLGHSGVQVITVQRILDFFNNDVMPIVYDRGSLGASGDLAPLANLFLPLIGVGDVYYKGSLPPFQESRPYCRSFPRSFRWAYRSFYGLYPANPSASGTNRDRR